MADETPDNESLTEILPRAIGEWLKSQVPMLKEYFEEWPEPNLQMDMPSAAITLGTPEFRPLAPYYIKPEAGEITDHAATIKWVTGIYDFKIKIDLWAKNKEERDDLFDAVFNALNPNISPMGLVLPLADYFNQLCELVYVGHTLGDTEEQAQRSEWRMTLDVLGTCKSIRTRKEFVIETTEINAQAFNTAEPIE